MEKTPIQANNISEDPSERVICEQSCSNQNDNVPNVQANYAVYSPNLVVNGNNIYSSVKINNSNSPNPPTQRPQSEVNANYSFTKNDSSIDKAIRLGFIKKVYSLLTIQLLITFGAVCLTFIKDVRIFLKNHFFIFYLASAVAIIVLILSCCVQKGLKKVPWNYIMLFSWTISITYMIMTTCAYYDKEIVITTMGLTAAVSVGLTVYAFIPKNDFSYLGNIVSILTMVIVFYAVFGFCFHKWVYFIYCALGVILFGLYIIYDTKQIIGDLIVKYEIDDYVIATLALYTDIINLFLVLLSLLGLISK